MKVNTAANHRRPRRRGRPAAVLLALALLLGTAAAAGAARWEPAADGHSVSLVTAADGVVHTTAKAVVARRSIAVPDSDLELELWDEVSATGERISYYAVVADNGARLRGRVRATDYAVELVDRRFDPLTQGEPLVAPALAARPGDPIFLVQTLVTPLPELQRQIEAAGGVIYRYLTQHAMIVELAGNARAEVAALPFVRWVGPYHPMYRLEPVLRELVTTAAGDQTPARYSVMLFERGEAAQQALAATLRGLGGTLEVLTPEGMRLEATLTPAQLAELAHDQRVQYIDRWGGPVQEDMDNVRIVGGADYLESVAGYTGQGVRGEIFDTGNRTTHQEWANTPIVHSASAAGSNHGTSVMSNVFAQGINPPARGMLPDGQPIFFRASECTQFGGGVTRYTISSELLDGAGPYRAVFQTSSVGNTRTFFYTTISAEMDDMLFLHQLLHTQSQSNAGNQDSRPQAWAKNIVSVGGMRHFDNSDRSDDNWGFSASIGPADDGRIKPDLAFYYDSIFSADGDSDTDYTTGFGGTSSATPQTAGHFGLLFQMWHKGVWTGHGGGATVFDSRPHLTTAKALMIHNAHRYDWNVVGANSDIDRFKQGWGTADVRNLWDTASRTTVIDESEVLAPLGSYSTMVEVPGAGGGELKATLVYIDPMGTPGAGVDRINDLSLKVTSPSAVVYWGNNGLTAGNFSTAGGDSNTLDTVENVFVADPEPGNWTVEVLADEVVSDSHTETVDVDADFSLVISTVGATLFADGFESGDTAAWSAAVP